MRADAAFIGENDTHAHASVGMALLQ